MSNSLKLIGLLLIILVLPLSVVLAQEEISDEELGKFADAVVAVQTQNMKIQQDMVAILENEELDIERFMQIQISKDNPEVKNNATVDEMAKYDKVMNKIDEMQPAIEKKMENIVKKAGFSAERFKLLGQMVQQDEDLRQRLQTMIMKKHSSDVIL